MGILGTMIAVVRLAFLLQLLIFSWVTLLVNGQSRFGNASVLMLLKGLQSTNYPFQRMGSSRVHKPCCIDVTSQLHRVRCLKVWWWNSSWTVYVKSGSQPHADPIWRFLDCGGCWSAVQVVVARADAGRFAAAVVVTSRPESEADQCGFFVMSSLPRSRPSL